MTPRETILDEAEFMLSCGESPHAIARLFGIQEGSVSRALYRAGRRDLAVIFEAARRKGTDGVCAGCGARTHRPTITRCRSCGNKRREQLRHEGAAVHCPRPGCPRYLNDLGRCHNHGDVTRAAA